MRTLFVLFLLVIFSCKNDTQEKEAQLRVDLKKNYSDVSLDVYDFEELKALLNTSTDKIYVVNFWATWCAPCIKEMPYFETLNATYKNRNVEVLLVSLDFPKKYDSHLKPFIKKNGLKSKVVALNDADSNTWIPQVSPDWSGAIPATLIFNKDKRQFYEHSFTYEELEHELKQFLN